MYIAREAHSANIGAPRLSACSKDCAGQITWRLAPSGVVASASTFDAFRQLSTNSMHEIFIASEASEAKKDSMRCSLAASGARYNALPLVAQELGGK